VQPELRAKAHGKPHAVVESAVLDVEADARQVGAEHGADPEGDPARQAREHGDGLEFVLVNQGFTCPGNVVPVGGSEPDAVDRAPLTATYAGVKWVKLEIALWDCSGME